MICVALPVVVCMALLCDLTCGVWHYCVILRVVCMALLCDLSVVCVELFCHLTCGICDITCRMYGIIV